MARRLVSRPSPTPKHFHNQVSAHYQERGAQQRKDRILGVLMDRAVRQRSANRARLKNDHGLVLQRIEVAAREGDVRTPRDGQTVKR